jgi:hypothetical protein
MLRSVKQLYGLALLAISAQSVLGFSLLGPVNEAFQTPTIGYDLPVDIGAPKNLGEEFRWNTPTNYYAFDANFLDYFGSNGVVAVEQAIAILNSLTNFSAMSSDLSEFSLETVRINYRAQAINLLDLKSVTLNLMTEELGLTYSDRYTWCLRDRRPRPGLSCPFMIYDVIKRNFDPVTFEPSSYVNGNLYSYQIIEICSGPDPLADAEEFPVDPISPQFSAVVSLGIYDYGFFLTTLTRDDVGGLRYLMRTNNMNVEAVSDSSLLVLTNTTTSQLLFTSNLTLLAMQGLTNNAAQLQALYPGLIVASTTNIFTNVVTTNVFAYFTNFPWSSPGSAASLVLVTNLSTNVAVYFRHTFANVVTVTNSPNSLVSVLDTNVTFTTSPWSPPPGVLQSNVTLTTSVLSNVPSGYFYIIPTNLCGLSIIATQLVTVVPETNTVVVATNGPGVTNVALQQFTRSFITYFTNFIFVVYPVECLTNTVALRQGMDKITFLRANYDSLLGRFFQPITNRYRLVAVTNSQPVVQTFERVVTSPDFLFTARDLLRTSALRTETAGNFRTDNALRGLAGPGNIEPNMEIVFNKVGPLLINFGPFFIDEATAITNFIWGSFDGSTNAPIVYPNGTSIMNLENQILIQISPATLPDGSVGVDYTNVFGGFTATGGQPPYTWSLSPGSPGLPPGLLLAANGAIFGRPTVDGVYDFVVRLTDSGARTVDRNFSITINP